MKGTAMAQNVETVTTIEQAREHLGIMLADHGKRNVEQHICNALNVYEATVIIPSHDVEIVHFHGSHWLSDEKIIELVNLLNKGV